MWSIRVSSWRARREVRDDRFEGGFIEAVEVAAFGQFTQRGQDMGTQLVTFLAIFRPFLSFLVSFLD